MKAFSLAIALLLTLPLALRAQKDSPYFVKDFSTSGRGTVHVSTSGGNIEVNGERGSQARVEMYVRGSNWKDRLSDDEIEERLSDYEITIEKRGNDIYAIAKRRSNISWKRGLSVSFKVFVPRDFSSDLNTSGGNIAVAGLEGRQEVNTSGGNISVNEVYGNTRLNTSGGNISVNQFEGQLAVSCSGGNISLKQASGEMKVHTSGGNISISQASGSVDAVTSGGNIGAEISGLEKYLTLSTSGGNINARIPDNLGMDLDIRGDRVHTNLRRFDGYLGKDKVEGKANGGGVPVKIRTSGGNIHLN